MSAVRCKRSTFALFVPRGTRARYLGFGRLFAYLPRCLVKLLLTFRSFRVSFFVGVRLSAVLLCQNDCEHWRQSCVENYGDQGTRQGHCHRVDISAPVLPLSVHEIDEEAQT